VLKGAPVHVGSLLQKALFEKKETVVITSATLSTGGHFRYMKERLSLENPQELLLGTPFDYKGGVLLFLPSDVPPPDAAGYQHAVQEALVSIARAAQGRTLALFTSHAALRGVYPQVQEALAEAGILVLGQGIDGAPQQVLGQFRSDPKAVLLGTSSFWEGVDLPGDALRVLVVTRLPFSVPTDPVYAARAEAFDDPFNGYGVPQAVLRFKQGFGRLMRRKSDRGVVVVLDRRIQTKAYGPEFLNSLPPCTTRSGPLRSLPQEIARWLGRDTERAR
jgi:DNA polymerase-3 subunit epsilon/ATP-dependent DNA helicase DinG